MAEQDEISLEKAIRNKFGTFDRTEFCEDREDGDCLIEEFYHLSNPHNIQANIAYFPKESKATVYLYALTNLDDLDSVIQELQDLKKRVEAFERKGYDISKASLAHEDATGDYKEFVVDVPISTQEELDRLVGSLDGLTPD